MAVNTNKLKLKFNDECLPRLFSTQADTNREFIINITDEDDNQVDITGMSLDFFVGNDKQVTKVAGTIKDGKNGIFIVKAVNSQFKYPGLNKAQFILSDGNGGKIGSQLIDLWVEESIENGATVGQNVIVDFETIKTAVDLIKNYEKIFEESKMINVDLKESISTGVNLDTELKTSTSKANSAKKSLDGSINKANNVKSDLDSSVSKGIDTKTNLDVSIKTAETTKTNLNSSNTTATTTKTELDKSIELAKTKKTELDGSVSTAKTTKTTLDSSIKTGKDVNTKSASLKKKLDTSVTNATNVKTELDTSTDTAKKVKTELDGSIASATAKNTELKGTTTTAESTDTEAKKTIETLQALLTKSEGSEKSLREIIASGNLDKYVTDPKLQEALKDYATKTELENIDVTSKLGDYALKTDLKTKLSEMVGDETHRTVTDTEKTTWNSKVGKGDDISDNIVVYNECTDDVCNANTKKTISEALNYINQSWQDSTAQLYNAYVGLQNDVAGLEASKASTTDIKTKLSELTSDATHRTVTDTEKTTWNNKVDKVSGKGLSTNDFTSTHKRKLDNLSSTATGSEATTSNRGYMSAADKKKLDGIDLSKYAGANDLASLVQEVVKTNQSVEKAEGIAREAAQMAQGAIQGAGEARETARNARAGSEQALATVAQTQNDIKDHKRCIILTQSEYDALSSTEKNRADTLYFIKE